MKCKPKRVAVSSSWAVNRNPPSPEMDTIWVPGRTMAAAMAQGSATPRVCWPLENSTRRGSIPAKVSGHVDVVRPDVAGDGGVIVDQFTNLQHDAPPGSGRHHWPDGRGVLVDSASASRCSAMRGVSVVGELQPRQQPGELGQGRGDIAAQLQRGLIVVVDAGGDLVDVDRPCGSGRCSTGRGSYSTGS